MNGGQEGELILGSKAEEGGGEPSLEGGKVVSLTRGCGRGCLSWSERRWSEPEISGEQFHATPGKRTCERSALERRQR